MTSPTFRGAATGHREESHKDKPHYESRTHIFEDKKESERDAHAQHHGEGVFNTRHLKPAQGFRHKSLLA